MLRGNRRYQLAIIGVALFSLLTGGLFIAILEQEYGIIPAHHRIPVEGQATGAASDEDETASNAPALARLYGGEKVREPDCGTPRECRAEQREKDDLIAQQIMAEAAIRQARAVEWQTAIAFLGVVLLIATLIYTSRSTRAAFRTIETMKELEQGRLIPVIGDSIARSDGVTTTINFTVRNVGRTAAYLKEVVFCKGAVASSSDVTGDKRTRTSLAIQGGSREVVDYYTLPTNPVLFPLVWGYITYTTIFTNTPIRHDFCIRLGRHKDDGTVECVAAPLPK